MPGVLSDNACLAPDSAALDHGLSAVAPLLGVADRREWAGVLAEPLRRAAIVTPRTLAAFLGQCAVESGGFRVLEENLSYSAGRLCQVWPNRFPALADAHACVAQPQVLANRVYAGRLGNGDAASGDGWRFRGRGLIQITGRAAYQQFAAAMQLDLDAAVAFAATRAGAVESATWFWTRNRLNDLAASWSIDRLTQTINGGMTGSAERTRLCTAALHAIGG